MEVCSQVAVGVKRMALIPEAGFTLVTNISNRVLALVTVFEAPQRTWPASGFSSSMRQTHPSLPTPLRLLIFSSNNCCGRFWNPLVWSVAFLSSHEATFPSPG